jgi:hypothetical protein
VTQIIARVRRYKDGAPGYLGHMAKWQLALVAVFLVVFGITVILTGNPTYLIAAVMIAALVVGWALLNRAMTKRVAAKHDSIEDAMSDESEPIPSSHLIPDSETAAGDTPEAHDEINPHDIPPDHPGRQAAEAEAEEEPRDDGARTTRGDDDLAQAAPEREERLEPSGEQRGG